MKDPDKAVMEWLESEYNSSIEENPFSALAFKAGAQWQQQQDRWIPIEDSEDMPLPPFEEKTQIICENGEQYIGYFNGADNHGYVWFCDNNDYHYPTHWKELPSSPTE